MLKWVSLRDSDVDRLGCVHDDSLFDCVGLRIIIDVWAVEMVWVIWLSSLVLLMTCVLFEILFKYENSRGVFVDELDCFDFVRRRTGFCVFEDSLDESKSGMLFRNTKESCCDVCEYKGINVVWRCLMENFWKSFLKNVNFVVMTTSPQGNRHVNDFLYIFKMTWSCYDNFSVEEWFRCIDTSLLMNFFVQTVDEVDR